VGRTHNEDGGKGVTRENPKCKAQWRKGSRKIKTRDGLMMQKVISQIWALETARRLQKIH
jgi:hypothetical protein